MAAQQTKLLSQSGRMILVIMLAVCLQAGQARADDAGAGKTSAASADASAASADAGAPLLGKWEQYFPRGKIEVEFTKTTITFTLADQNGVTSSAGNSVDVTAYKQLEKNDKDQLISIDVKNKSGGSTAALVIVRSKDAILLDFPGIGGYSLTRVVGK
jgi:hypothetical protein